MKTNTVGTTPSIRLLGLGVDDELVKEAIAVKCIAALMADPNTKLDPKVFAERIGATEAQVWAILQSPTYLEILRDHLQTFGMGCMARSFSVLNAIVCDENQKTSDRISAARVEASYYATIATIEPKHLEGTAREKMLRVLDKAKGVAVELSKEPDEDNRK